MKRLSPRLAFVASLTALSLALGGIAFADNTVPDGDDTTPIAANPLAFGTVCVNSTTDAHALVAISRNGNGNVFKNGAMVTVSILSVSGAGLSASMDATTITLPSNWEAAANNTISEAVSSKITYQAGAATGGFTGSVSYRATGLDTNNASLSRDATMPVSATRSNTGSCAPVPSDTTKPTVTVSFPSPVSGQNGYFNAADVVPVVGTVSASDASNVTNISCTGATLSGVTGYNTNTASGTLTVTGDGTHNVSCSATDGASPVNTGAAPGSANTATIKIDTTAPSITDGGFGSGDAGSNGWYTSQVTNKFSASDDTSGLADCTANFTKYSGTDQGTSVRIASGPCSDLAGNTNAGIESAAYKIDKTGPSAVLTATGTEGAHGWFTSNVTIETTGSDSISGPVTCTGDQTQTDETTGTEFNGKCTNNAGLSTDAAPLTVKLDKTGPSAHLTASGDEGLNGWFVGNVTIKTAGSDDVSGEVTCTDDQTETDETSGTEFDGQCTNDAGLTTDASPLTVKLDKTGPAAALSASGDQGTNDWFIGDVTIKTSGSDDISGIASCSDDQSQPVETTGAVFNGSCTNNAGLSTNAAPLTVKLDKTAPTATQTPTGTLGTNGWFIGDVTITTTGGDSISEPVTCTDVQSQTDETTGTDFNGKCTNDAGLSTDAAPVTVKLDKTGPTATLTPTGTEGAHGWFTSDVTVTASGTDSVSDPVTCTAPQSQTDETTGQLFSGSCTNDAGLSTNADPITVKVDKSGPTAILSALGTLGNNGWYVSDVTVQTDGSDTISGPVTCSDDQLLTTDTTGQAFNGSCTNDAGLTTDATALTVKRDATKPALSPSVSPNPVVLNGSATASANATDGTSGLFSSSCDAVDTSSIGALRLVSCSATDNAGNTNTGSAPYGVIYNWFGFFQPVENLPTWNVAKAGQSIPVKFSLSGNQGLNILKTGYPKVTSIACPTASAPTDAIEAYATTANNGLIYDASANQYNFVWKTDKVWAGKCFSFDLGLIDGSSHTLKVQFTK